MSDLLTTDALYQACTAIYLGTQKAADAFVGACGPSARPVELPWVSEQLRRLTPGRMLDIGLSLADLSYLRFLLDLRARHRLDLHAVDIIAPTRVRSRYPALWWPELAAVPLALGDVRATPPPGVAYDVVTCISVIEHIGYDAPSKADDKASAFARARCPEDVALDRPQRTDREVLEAIRQTLRPGGHLLLTVPAGAGGPVVLRDSLGYYCAQYEYDVDGWRRLTSHPGFEPVAERFFRLSEAMRWEEVAEPESLANMVAVAGSHSRGCALALLRRA